MIYELENEVVRQRLHRPQHLPFSNVISLEDSGDDGDKIPMNEHKKYEGIEIKEKECKYFCV